MVETACIPSRLVGTSGIPLGGGGYQIISTGTFADRSNEAMKTPGSSRQQKQTREADAAATPGGLKNSPAGSAELKDLWRI